MDGVVDLAAVTRRRNKPEPEQSELGWMATFARDDTHPNMFPIVILSLNGDPVMNMTPDDTVQFCVAGLTAALSLRENSKLLGVLGDLGYSEERINLLMSKIMTAHQDGQ